MSNTGPAKRGRDALSLTIQVATRSRRLPAAAKIRSWTRACLRRPAEVTVRFVGRREGETLNRAYRGKAYATNVLTFCYETGPRLSGDIVLCAPVVSSEARAQKKPFEAHCAHLTVHGLLHLQGYDHESAREARAMEAIEVTILRRLGFPNPYLPRLPAARR